jgi:ABC-2 type transport system permease protein
MQELKLLLKYVGLSIYSTYSNTSKSKKKKDENNGGAKESNYSIRYLLLMLVSMLPISIFTFAANYKIYKTLSIYPDVAKAFYALSMSMFSLFFIVGFAGTGMHAFSRSDEMELLLTMPIRRNVLSLYNLIVTLASQFFTIGFFLAVALAYVLAFKTKVFYFLLQTLLQLAFITSLSALLAIIGGGISSKKFVRMLNTIIMLLLIFLYLFFVYAQDIDVTGLAQNTTFVKFIYFATSKYNPLMWAYSEKIEFVLLDLFITFVTGYLFWYFAGRVVYENTQGKTNKITVESAFKKDSYAVKIGGFLWKDTKYLIRSEQFLFLILYPAMFSLFMLFAGGSSMNASIPFLAVATLYCAMESGLLTRNDFEYKELLRTLPVTLRTIITPKLSIPIAINEIMLIAVLLVSYIIGKYDKTGLILLPISIALFALSALIGSYYSIVEPGKSKNNPFSTRTTFIIEGITLGIAFGLLFPINLLLSKAKLDGWKFFSVWGVLIVSATALIILTVLYYKKLESTLTQKD